MRAWVGLTQTRPTLFCSWPFDQDPDGSGSIQRSWSVSLIRIHQIRGFWAFYPQTLVFTRFLDSVTMCTPVCAICASTHVNFLAKIPKNLPYVSWYIFIVWWCFHTLKWIKSRRANFYWIHMFWYFLWIFLCYFGPNFCSMELILDAWFLWCVHLWIHAISIFLHA